MLILLNWFVFGHKTVEACIAMDSENYWYTESYEIDLAALPFDVEYAEERAEGSRGAIPTLYFKSNDERDIYLFHSLEDVLDLGQNHVFNAISSQSELDSLHLNIAAGLKLPTQQDIDDGLEYYDELGEFYRFDPPMYRLPSGNLVSIHRPESVIPEPSVTNLIFTDLKDLWRVPITTTYQLNPYYDHMQLTDPDAPSSDRTLVTDYIAVGKLLGASKRSRKMQNDSLVYEMPREGNEENKRVLGVGLVEVTTWLKGEGPGLIHVSEFGMGPDCLQQGDVNGQYIFYFQSFDPEHGTASLQPWLWHDPAEPYSSSKAAEVEQQVGHAPFVPEPPSTEQISDALSDFVPMHEVLEDGSILLSTGKGVSAAVQAATIAAIEQSVVNEPVTTPEPSITQSNPPSTQGWLMVGLVGIIALAFGFYVRRP